MPFFTAPTSFRLASRSGMEPPELFAQGPALPIGAYAMRPPHSSHPDFGHLTLLVLEAVLEVVFVSLPGYIVARAGMFDAGSQKFVANLNVMVFLPCLIFTKLASQLNAKMLSDLAIIPFIFVAQVTISWVCSWAMSKIFRFEKRPRNFVTAMAVFGNSNSLPISLVISLSKTISGLHWSAIPGDNDDEVASRGILYLLIFQQLGQLVRWTWGYNVLLAPREAYEEEEPRATEEATAAQSHDVEANDTQPEERFLPLPSECSQESMAGERTPVNHQARVGSSESSKTPSVRGVSRATSPKKQPANGPGPDPSDEADDAEETDPLIPLPNQVQGKVKGARRQWHAALKALRNRRLAVQKSVSKSSTTAFHKLPEPLQRFLRRAARGLARFARGVWEFMNPPLWAMLAAILVASIPRLQALFFTPGSFVHNTFTRGVGQSGGVAVPLILVVLGANLARNTLPSPAEPGVEACDRRVEGRLLFASIVSRMLLPTVFMAPLLALAAKFLPISILDDPIFVIVCFLLTGAPSALQLAQICQINNVYVGAMSRLLFQSYVVWILPSTLILVMLALEVVEWAHP